MQVILIKDVKNLGTRGEIKEVSNGYAQNFLLPRGMAKPAVGKIVDQVKKQVEQKKVTKAKNSLKPEQVAQKLRGITLTFKEKADEGGKFFAGITKEKIATALKEKQLFIKPKQINLNEPIKNEGKRKVDINVDSGLKSFVMVEAIKE